MLDAPIGLALAAGMLAAVNPCGFALLPAYLTLFVLGDDSPGRSTAVRRALVASAAMTAGFTVVFGVFGLAVAPVAGQVQQHLPWVTIVIGVALIGLGGWLVAGRDVPGLQLARPGGRPITRTTRSMATFGTAYAIASLSCTIGPFLAIVVTSFRAGSPIAGTALFLAYAAGMGLSVSVAALAVALARGSLVTRMRRFTPALGRLGGALMVGAGTYVAYYGWWEVRVLAGGDATDPVVDAAAAAQRWIARLLEGAGAPAIAGVVLLLVLLVVVVSSLREKRDARMLSPEALREPRAGAGDLSRRRPPSA